MNPVLLNFLGLLACGAATFACAVAWRRERRYDLAVAGVSDDRRASVWRALLGPVARRMRPTGKDLDDLIARLQHAGRRDREEVERFLEEKLIALLLGAGAGLGVVAVVPGKLGLLLMMLAIFIGLLLPKALLSSRADKRREAVSQSLPAAIDLLTTCVDAGLSVEQAIARVAKEFARSSPILAEEFALAASETEAGVSLTESLRRLARRVDVEDLSGLCGIISQAHELGAPIVATLQDYAETSRRLRLATLEERAGKLATKLIFPLALFLLPASMVAIIGPSAIQLMRSLN